MGIRVKLSGSVCISGALLCLLLPLDWMAAAVTAGAFHELCHILAVKATGGEIYALEISPGGAVMDVSSAEPWKELLYAMAGPAGSFSLLLLEACVPKVALCGLMQGFYNLLPIYPMDGGRILTCMVCILFSEKTAGKVRVLIQNITILLVMMAGLWGTFVLKLGLTPILVSVFVLSRAVSEKFLANRENKEYNRVTI